MSLRKPRGRSDENVAGRQLQRRELLRIAGVAGIVTALADVSVLAPRAAATPRSTSPSTRTVYRRAPIRSTTCNACKAHDASRYYRTTTAANDNPPHLGCDCAIVSHKIPVNRWNAYFKHAGADRTVWDIRWSNTKNTKEAKA